MKYCENKPEVVDRSGIKVLKRLELKYRYETFDERNAVEGFFFKLFFKLKERTKRFWNRFPYRSSFNSIQSWLESFVAFYNYWRCLS